jgi:uroporphyrinogen-III decarboxylase
MSYNYCARNYCARPSRVSQNTPAGIPRTFTDLNSNPEKMEDFILASHKFAGLEAVCYPYCPTVLTEIMGCSIRMGTKEIQPLVFTHPFSKGPEYLNIPEFFRIIQHLSFVTCQVYSFYMIK